jgi:ATP-dependent Clp protease adaptor protein ClpS
MAEQTDDPKPGPGASGGPDAPGGADAASSADSAGPATATKVAPRQRAKIEPQQLPPFNVVLLDDDDHSYEYVIEMLGKVFAHPFERAYQMAKEVDKSGRVIVLTTHKEKAELKRDQVLAYGPDVRIARSTQSMRSVIEPAEG